MSLTMVENRTAGLRLRPWLLALIVALPVAAALSWPSAMAVWHTGDFVNSDDATRMVQIRDWMAGQGWFDLAAHRMGLPPGVFSHWSRVVDVPISALILLFRLWFSPEMAERAARIAYPALLQGGMVCAMGYAARVLAGPAAVVPAALIIVLAGIGAGQFEPGRIHHHAPQILLLALMTATTLDALDPARARRAAVTGLLVALSLAIGLENLPFLAVVLATPPLAWAARGGAMRPALLWFCGGLAASSLALFAALVPPWRYSVTSVDAFSLMHLVGIGIGTALLAVAGLATPGPASPATRLAVLAGAAVLLGAAMLAGFPEGLHGPFYGMDPLLHPFWLDDVQEVRPLSRLVREVPGTVVVLMAPMVAGIALAGCALVRSRGLARGRWAVVAALAVVGLAGSFWGVRVASSLQPVALLGGAWGLARTWRAAERDGRILALWRPAAVLALCSSVAWSLLPWPGAAAEPAGEGDMTCLASAAVAPLAALPPGALFAPIDLGPFVLADTGLSVLAAPYHRDNSGNRAVIEGFLADPDTARAIVRGSGARYLAVCGDETGPESRAAPAGLAAALRDGRVPAWLDPVLLGPTPIRVFAVR